MSKKTKGKDGNGFMVCNDLVSVVVPVFNVEAYLNRCIDSIISQTYRKLEIILIDDGSTDSCPIICDEYKQLDDRIIVFHQENRGLSAARNVGILASKGKYIAFVDSDDYVDEKFVEKMYLTMIEENSDIVVCDIRSYDANTNQMFPCSRYLDDGPVDTDHIFETMMRGDYPWIYTMACNKLYSRKLFGKALFPTGLIHEDEIIFLEYIKQSARIYQISDPLYFYTRGRENSIINRKYSTKRLDVLVAYYDRIEFFKQKGDKARELVKNERWKILRKLSIVLKKTSFDEIEEIERFQKELRKASKEAVRDFVCLKIYLSMLFSIKYLSMIKKISSVKYREIKKKFKRY